MSDRNEKGAESPELEETIGKIRSTWLGYEDHGIFSLNIDFDWLIARGLRLG